MSDREVYHVYYDDLHGQRRVVDIPRRRGLAYVREGIWLDDKFQYGLGEKCVQWIPPARIVWVVKMDLPDEPSRLKAVA